MASVVFSAISSIFKTGFETLLNLCLLVLRTSLRRTSAITNPNSLVASFISIESRHLLYVFFKLQLAHSKEDRGSRAPYGLSRVGPRHGSCQGPLEAHPSSACREMLTLPSLQQEILRSSQCVRYHGISKYITQTAPQCGSHMVRTRLRIIWTSKLRGPSWQHSILIIA